MTEQAEQDAIAARLADAQAHSVECVLGDFSATARGKRVPVAEFLAGQGCKLPSVLLGMGVTGGAPDGVFGALLPASYGDLQLVPDLDTLAPRPGRPGEMTVLCEPAGQWFAPLYGREVAASEFSPRATLRRVLAEFERAGLGVRVAPELEMFLLQRHESMDGVRLEGARPWPGAPVRESACEQYSLERLTHFEAYFDALYAACAALGIPLAGHQHEAAFSQFELNFHPGAPLAQADAVFRFKRLAREIAARHGFLASFAAKPFLDQPGVGMHWHFSVQRLGAAGPNPPDAGQAWPHLFAEPDGRSTPALAQFVAGLQAGLPQAMALLAPYDMSFERITRSDASPSHADWGEEDRHVALRIPTSDAAGRRVENRLPGGDVNPYLAVAITLGLGLAGLRGALAATPGRDERLRLSRSLPDALDQLQHGTLVRQCLGDPLVDLFVALKRQEHQERAAAADPRQHWDLRHLVELA